MINHDIKPKQKRYWIDHYTKRPINRVYTVKYVGKKLAILETPDGEETVESIDTMMEESILVSKVRKDTLIEREGM